MNISNEDHNQTYCLTGWISDYAVTLADMQYYFQSPLCLFLFGAAMSPGEGSLFNFAHWHTAVCSVRLTAIVEL